jgi:membrane fusion protein (multidrug efflux system)
MIYKIVLYSLILLLVSCSNKSYEQSAAAEQTQAAAENDKNNRTVAVEAMIVKVKTINQKIPLTGIIEPIYEVDIIAEVSGKVKRIIKKLGERVTASDTLAFIDDEIPLSQYHQTQAQVLSAENDFHITQLNLKSDEELLANGDISKLEYEQSLLRLKSAKANYLSAKAQLSLMKKGYNNTRIMSPISGYISRKYVDIGTMVTPGMLLYRVVDLSTVKIDLGIAQDLINRIRIGSPAAVTISSLNDHSFSGYVKYISPQADENTGTFKVEIQIKNTGDTKIYAGMTARVDLTLVTLDEQLVIPDYTLVARNGSNHVYKIEKDIARLIDISIKETIGSEVIIGAGLFAGDTIVVVGMKNLGKETRVYIENVQQ